MKKYLKVLAVIGAMIFSFIIGHYTGYWHSPGMESMRSLRDLGMTPTEISESIQHTSERISEGFEYEYSMLASAGLSTLKSLDKDSIPEAEDIAIEQIRMYYMSKPRAEGAGESVSDSIEEYAPNNSKLQKMLSELPKSP